MIPNNYLLKREDLAEDRCPPYVPMASSSHLSRMPLLSPQHTHHSQHPQPPLPQPSTTVPDSATDFMPFSPSENVYECAAKLLFFSVKWARSIPSFLQLPFRDQAILLEETWCELFVISAAQWGLPIEDGENISIAADIFLRFFFSFEDVSFALDDTLDDGHTTHCVLRPLKTVTASIVSTSVTTKAC